jgi:hypothetical protein
MITEDDGRGSERTITDHEGTQHPSAPPYELLPWPRCLARWALLGYSGFSGLVILSCVGWVTEAA